MINMELKRKRKYTIHIIKLHKKYKDNPYASFDKKTGKWEMYSSRGKNKRYMEAVKKSKKYLEKVLK